MSDIEEPRWYYFHLNPEPWEIGQASVGRRGGKYYANIGRSEQLYSYQEAVRECFGEPDMMEGYLKLTFFFWRRLDTYRYEKERTARKHEADATNLQKALEDALQGYLFNNDKDNHDIRSIIVVQDEATEPAIIVKAEQFDTSVYRECIRTQWRNLP